MGLPFRAAQYIGYSVSLQYQHAQYTYHRQQCIFDVTSLFASCGNIIGKSDGALLPWMAATQGDSSG